jgi:hypothetical protein
MDTGLNSALEEILRRYGGRVQISRDPASGMWMATERPTPSCQAVWISATLAELAGKLARDLGD